ncbi:MAG: TlpA family protein disulfide reductase [Nannocystaceae bacterium]|nr:TlpA family protein disulfide reductase [Nannocystaceae bacterium]
MSGRLSLIVGAALVLGAAWSGGRELSRGVSSWSALGPLPPGLQAPRFRLFALDGGTVTGEDLQGSVTVMTFWATWCGACRGELADLDELDDEYADRDDVKFFAVNHEGGGLSRRQAQSVVRNYRVASGLKLPVVLDDGSAAQAFRVRPIPHTVVFDREGMIRHVHVGRISLATIRTEIDRLLADG